MKHLFVAGIAMLLSTACTKSKDAVLVNEATVTILHSTCVKTIFKIDAPNTTLGVAWSDTTKPVPVIYQHVFEAGKMKNTPTTGLESSKPYKVKIYTKATGPQIICQMFDPVNSPSVRYDIEFVP